MNLPKLAVKRPVFIIVIFTVMILFGLFSLKFIPIDLFPEIEPPAISVITAYPGAGAEEVEEKVSKILESALSQISNLEDITSRSMENVSTVSLKFKYGTDLNEAANDVRDQISLASSELPDDINQPIVFKFNFSMFPVMFFGVTSESEDVRFLYDDIKTYISEPLQRIPGVASAIMFNQIEKQIVVAADTQRLSALNLSLSDLTVAVSADNLSLPAGSILLGAYDYTIRVPGELKDVEEIKNSIVASTPKGLIRVKDVANVFWGGKELDQFALLDGKYMVFMMIQKQSGSNTVEVASAINKKIAEMKGKLPHGLELSTIMDSSVFIKNMVANLSQAVYYGGFFVLLVVIFFLRRFRSSIIVALSIPASLVIAFAFLYGFNYTLNMISLMALSLAIGMVVDNSIVVLDNITRHLEMGKSRVQAAIDGTSEVGGAVLASTLTTVMIFAPLFFISGLSGVMFKQLAGVVILTLSASLMAAMLLTPMLSSRLLGFKEETTDGSENFFFKASKWSMDKMEAFYGKIINFTLENRWKTILGIFIIFLFSMMIPGIIGMDFIPEQDSGDLYIEYELPLGTKAEETLKIGQHMMRIMREEVPDAKMFYARGGESESGFSSSIDGTNTGKAGLKATTLNEGRIVPMAVYAKKVRKRILNEIPGLEKVDIRASSSMSQMFSGGQKPITIQVANKNFDKAAHAAEKIVDILKSMKGIKDVTSDANMLKPEIEVKIDRLRASQVGLNVSMIASTVRTAFYGSKSSIFRENGEEYDIMVRLRKVDRESIDQLKDLELKTMTGNTVKLKDVAEIKEGTTHLAINRLNKERIVTVGARTDGVPISVISAKLDSEIDKLGFTPDIAVIYGGNLKEQAETSGDMFLVFLLGIILVYLVMAAQFESFVDPLIILVSIPFSMTGVFLGLLVGGFSLSMPAMLGMIILVGIVVNNAIVLIDYVNMLQREKGMSLIEAVKFGGVSRLRPVLMTATTTICGMVPLVFMSGDGHETWQPMGTAVVSGLLVSTVVTLVIIPTLYASVTSFILNRKAKKTVKV